MSIHTPAEVHDHRHGADCGHKAVQHGDHLDYLHDGHAHFEHDGHYDECAKCKCPGCDDLCAVCACSDCTCATCNHAA
ncbi:MAG: hypothetical protein FJW97_08460 [Actinobacteria bacterium]|nr:hypothetical protein [Actinomycetota bacterium]